MKCFYHSDQDAVGICKSCNRGLCRECCAELNPGLACRGKCETDVASLNALVERGKNAYAVAGSACRRNAIVLLIIGIGFLSLGIIPVLVAGHYAALVFALLSPVFFLLSYSCYRSCKQYARLQK